MNHPEEIRKGRKPSTVLLRPAEWPEEDHLLWAYARRDGNVLEKSARTRNWSPETVRNVEASYGHWLKWLRDSEPGYWKLSATDRVTRETVRAYICHMQMRLSPFTVQIHLQRLGQIMTAFTETADFRWLFRAANRLRPRSVRNKKAKIRTPYELVQLGFHLMKEAEGMGTSWNHHRSLKFRNGLIIALLAYRPVRLSNLAGIVVDRHLLRTNDGFALTFAAHETKKREALEFPLPKSLIKPMEAYLAEHRLALLGTNSKEESAGPRLWISRGGGSLAAQCISDIVRDATKTAFGDSINPHLFRDCAATTIAIDDPEHAHIIAKILGHSSMSTSELHYNQARTMDAAEQYHQALAQARRQHSPVKQQAPRVAQ